MFINRQQDTIYLQSDFLNSSDKSRFLIMSAPTGYGKSELVNQALGSYEKFIRVKVAKHEGSRNISSLHIKELGRALNHLAEFKNQITLFRDNFKKNEGSLKSLILGIFGDVAKNKLKNEVLGKWIKEGSGYNKQDLIETVFSSDQSEAFVAVSKYIKQTLKNGKFIIALENIQNIDKESLIFLRELLVSNNSIYLVGEYTEDENSQIDKFELLNYFIGPYIKTDIIQLKKLALEDIINDCKDRPDVIVEILKDSYNQSSGNLHPLQILFLDGFPNSIQKSNNKINYDEIISREINSLNADESFVLASVVAHGGKVDFEIFKSFNKKEKLIQGQYLYLISISELIKRLVDKKLICISHNIVETAQDSIIQVVLTDEMFSKYILISYRKWLLFYQSLKEINEDLFLPRSEIISWEIFFRALLEDLSGMNTLLNEVYKLTLLSATPKRAIRYLEKIEICLNKNIYIQNKKNISREINLNIIRTLFRLWYFDEIPLYSKHHLDDPLIFLFHVSSLAVIGEADEAIRLCNQFIEITNNDYKLGAFLVRIAAYRASNRYRECEEEWIRLYKLNIFHKTPFEAMFLRCADLALLSDCKEQIKYIKESIQLFEKSSQILQEISARNALAQYLGYEGDLAGAEEELLKAEEKVKKIFIRHYVLENNFCVLDLQKEISNKKIIEKLESAATICETVLDRFIIWNNLFIAQSMSHYQEESESTIRAIEQKIFNSEIVDYDLKRIALFNAHVHYKRLNNQDLSDYYLTRAKELPILADKEFWDVKFYGKSNNDYKDFRLSFDYYPVYITYWHFDFDSVLDNSQLEV